VKPKEIGFSFYSLLHPVESPTTYGGRRKKCSFLIENGVQSPSLSNGVCFILNHSHKGFNTTRIEEGMPH
jgi:hypothetical protein